VIGVSIDSGRKVFVKQPWNIISFLDENGWHAALVDAIKNSYTHDNENDKQGNKSDDNIRFGVFDYPGNNGAYKGRFIDGRKEGKGPFSFLKPLFPFHFLFTTFIF
jgi:hypothetical protein